MHSLTLRPSVHAGDLLRRLHAAATSACEALRLESRPTSYLHTHYQARQGGEETACGGAGVQCVGVPERVFQNRRLRGRLAIN